jgi:hypothetical protein
VELIRVKKILLLLAATTLFALPLRAQQEASVRVFVLKYKRVEEAALLIRPHLSESASITLTQKLNAMTITDKPEKLDEIGKVLTSFDVPPRAFTFSIKLVRARADVPEGSIAREIGGLGAKLRSLFAFNDYVLIDSNVLRGVEGGRVHCQLGSEYSLDFTIRPVGSGNELILSPFTLWKIYKPGKPDSVVRPLYRAAIAAALSQTLVVGASKEESSKTALILVLLAQELPRVDAGKGANGAKSVEKRP